MCLASDSGMFSFEYGLACSSSDCLTCTLANQASRLCNSASTFWLPRSPPHPPPPPRCGTLPSLVLMRPAEFLGVSRLHP